MLGTSLGEAAGTRVWRRLLVSVWMLGPKASERRHQSNGKILFSFCMVPCRNGKACVIKPTCYSHRIFLSRHVLYLGHDLVSDGMDCMQDGT